MKKVMFAAAAIAAGVALAEVQSANVVGYQNSTVLNSSKLVTATFIKVDGSEKKLGDYVPSSAKLTLDRFTGSNFYLNFYNAKGAQRKVADDTEIARLWPAAIEDATIKDKVVSLTYYYKETTKGTPDADIGWYLVADRSTRKYPLNDYVLKDGDGFLMSVGSAHGTAEGQGVTLVYSGAVDPEATPIRVMNASELTGNMTPTTVKLGQMVPSSAKLTLDRFTGSNFYLNFYNAKGAQRKVADDAEIARLWPAAIEDATIKDKVVSLTYYYKETTKGTPDADIGWYLVADRSTRKYPLNNYELKSSDGFLMSVGSAHGTAEGQGVTLEFPSALPAAK